MDIVVASRPPTSTCASRPNTMPRGLVRNTRPFASRRPKIWLGSEPVTRFTSTELLDGCSTRRLSLVPMEKLFQSMLARSVPWRISILLPAGCVIWAVPCVTLAPSGSATATWLPPVASRQARQTGVTVR